MTVAAEVVAIVAAAVAVFAAVLAVRATALVARTVLANPPGGVPPESITIRVTEGNTRRDIGADSRDYAFVVTVSNHTASPRRFDPPGLRITFRTRANFLGAVDVPSTEPIAAPAGQTVTATIRFTTSNVVPRHSRIDAYTLVFVDESGDRRGVDASLPGMLQADTDGTGPATWGLD